MDEPEPSVVANGVSVRPRSLLDLGLRGPTLGVLQRQGLLSVDQLVELSPDELMGLRRVGLSRMLEVRRALQSHGLDLQTAIEEVPERVWAFETRVTLACCEYGECSLEIRTEGADPVQAELVAAAFVAAHRGCERLNGCEPVLGKVETSHSSR